ncbi:uncharacterized protein BKA78DRAFT_159684 [Phyllosticta capitalensis]|uniref:uncharacterized protein n=1 Tax=Phyllosticta capitalensis TaxID=121624 RepID=UPI00313282D5
MSAGVLFLGLPIRFQATRSLPTSPKLCTYNVSAGTDAIYLEMLTSNSSSLPSSGLMRYSRSSSSAILRILPNASRCLSSLVSSCRDIHFQLWLCSCSCFFSSTS